MPEPWLATLPISGGFIASMLTTMPASLLMGKYGRKPIFMAGAVLLFLGMMVQMQMLLAGNFTGYMARRIVDRRGHMALPVLSLCRRRCLARGKKIRCCLTGAGRADRCLCRRNHRQDEPWLVWWVDLYASRFLAAGDYHAATFCCLPG